MMIQYINLLWEPALLIGGCIAVFYSFDWILNKIADWLGVEEDLD